MTQSIPSQIQAKLPHIYISPLEQCNLHCKICYTTKTKNRLTKNQILDFINRYNLETPLQTITFCGGEVFLMTDFIDIVNELTSQGFFIQIITNGTIDKLSRLQHPNLINLIVSIDGPEKYHDKNRGINQWKKSITFLKKAIRLGFHTEIFSIITAENIPNVDRFEALLQAELGQSIPITYHPRKPIAYLNQHPVSNQIGETDGFSFISIKDRQQMGQRHHIFPDLHFGCYQISLMSDGQVYGCCEGVRPLGSIDSDIKELIKVFVGRLNHTLNCVEPEFMCGLKSANLKEGTCH